MTVLSPPPLAVSHEIRCRPMEKAKHLPGSGETPAQRRLAVREDEPGFAGGGAELPLGEPAEHGAPCDANRGGTCQISLTVRYRKKWKMHIMQKPCNFIPQKDHQ